MTNQINDKTMAAIANQHSKEQLEMNQLLGRIQATEAIGSMLETISLAQLKQIKESKSYKALLGQTIEVKGDTYKLDTWEGFCKAAGTSASAVDEKLQNLELLGEETLEKVEKLGLSTRTLRKLRKLDGEDRTIVMQEIEANLDDKDSVVELVDNLAAKHSKEKEALEKQLKASQEDAEATGKVIAKKNATIDKLEKQLVKQEHMTLDDKIKTALQQLGEAEVTGLSAVYQIAATFRGAFEDGEFISTSVEHRAATVLLNVRNNLNELLHQFQLGGLVIDQSIDEDWPTLGGVDDDTSDDSTAG